MYTLWDLILNSASYLVRHLLVFHHRCRARGQVGYALSFGVVVCKAGLSDDDCKITTWGNKCISVLVFKGLAVNRLDTSRKRAKNVLLYSELHVSDISPELLLLDSSDHLQRFLVDISKSLLVTELGSCRAPETVRVILSNMERLLCIPIHG